MPRKPNTTPRSRARATVLAAYFIILLAFALRLWRLTDSPLWYDETFTLYHASGGPVEAVVGSLRNDNALPFHTVLLSIWVLAAGQGEFAIRFSSVLIGMLAIPLVGRWAREMTGRRAGVGSMLAAATLPIIVYYSQEVRYPGLAFTLAALFGWLAWRLWRGKRGIIGYVLAGFGMQLAHAYTGFLWVTLLTASVIVWALRQRRFPARRWWAANAILAILGLPIAAWTLWRSQIDATAFSPTGWDMPRWLPVQYGVGDYLSQPWASLFPITALVSIVIGEWVLVRERRWGEFVFLILSLSLPIGLLLIASRFSGKWEPRYLLPSWGLALLLSAGMGWDLPRRWWRTAGFALALLWVGMTLPAIDVQARGREALLLRDATHPRPDFRAVAEYIAANGQEGDMIVVIAGPAAHTLDYHYRGSAPIIGLPDTIVFDTRNPLDLRTLRELETAVGSADRLWLVLWQASLVDPAAVIQTTLLENCERLGVGGHFLNVDLLLLDLTACRPLDALAEPPTPVGADFENIRLVGYELTRASDTYLTLDLWWESTGPTPETGYTTFVHLLNVSGDLLAQDDRPPGTELYPTAAWQPGVYVRMRHTLSLPAGESCESCLVRVGLYNDAGRLLLDSGADAIEIPVPGIDP